MTQQERIIKSAEEHIGCVSRTGRGWGKNFRAGFECAVEYTLENLWISAMDEKPESGELVFIALFDEVGEVYEYYEGWYDNARKQWYLRDYGHLNDVSYWMPIPTLVPPPDDLPF